MSAPVSATPIYARTGSTSSGSSSIAEPTERRSSSIFKKAGHRLAEHHRDVTAAYDAYYGAYYYGTVGAASSSTPERRKSSQVSQSIEEALGDAEPRKQSRASRAWEKVKQHAREHHESVNNAHRAVYGGAN